MEEGAINDPKSHSEKIMPTVSDPATQGKKAPGLSPTVHESNIKNKKLKQKKLNTILKKESRAIMRVSKQEKGGIIWDNKAIDEQKSYRIKHRLSTVQRHKMKSLSRTKYNSAVIGVEDDDEYLKNLIKVNQITLTDELIKNITNLLNEPKEYKKIRNKSTHVKIPNTFDLHGKAIKNAAENINVFEGVLDDESKITLQNTIINKFHKELLG
jgi:hypothetical protein